MALAKGAEMSDFNQAVLRCGSILAIKLGALNLLTVRSRMIKNDFTTGRPSKQVGRQTVETSSSRATMRHLIAKIDAPCPGLVVCLAARVGLDRRHVATRPCRPGSADFSRWPWARSGPPHRPNASPALWRTQWRTSPFSCVWLSLWPHLAPPER